MLNRLIRYALVGVFATAVAGYGNHALAQDDDDMGGDDGGGGGDDGGGGGDDAGGGGDTGGGDTGGGDTGGGDTGGAAEMGAKPPMLLAKGKIGVGVGVQVNLSKDLVAKPISIQPDVWYGVMPKLEVGVAHSSMGLSGWWGGIGGGLCVTGTDNGCAKFYNGPVGVIAHYLLVEGGVDLAADAGVVIRALDPDMLLDLKLGVMGRWMSGKIMVMFNPNIWAGLTKRDAGNKEYLSIPVAVGYMVSPKLAAGVQTGITGPLDHFGDFYSIPVSLGAHFMVNDNLAAFGAFNLFRVAGFEGPGAADLRGLTVGVEWHN